MPWRLHAGSIRPMPWQGRLAWHRRKKSSQTEGGGEAATAREKKRGYRGIVNESNATMRFEVLI